MSQHSGSGNSLSEHPASPALLTNPGPHRHTRSTWAALLRHHTHWARAPIAGHRPQNCHHSEHAQESERTAGQTPFTEAACLLSRWVCHAHSQFENRLRRHKLPKGFDQSLSCVALPDISHSSCGLSEPSYPEGNFEGNQLLGGSIGLSPLCRAQATQFARQNSELTSTTVSHGFVMAWHSSPPFGSHGPCNHSEPCPMDFSTGVLCWPLVTFQDRLLSPHPVVSCQPSGNRKLHRLLGPCYKTGREWHEPQAQALLCTQIPCNIWETGLPHRGHQPE